jgi:aminoglycoside phosphotransferase (APT) family kinase protein
VEVAQATWMGAGVWNDSDWPSGLRDEFGRRFDAPVAVERLGGMSGGRVQRVRVAGGSVVVKRATPHEARFYRRAAPKLRQAGVPIPDLFLAIDEPDGCWLVIEDVPTPLPVPPAGEWRPDPRVVAILARLHATTRDNPPEIPPPVARDWTDETTDAALARFPGGVAATLAPVLRQFQRANDRRGEPWCWVSGDPNPRNWSERQDGSLVLFDWELFAPGRPATDLAIAIPGLGAPEQFARMAATYAAEWRARRRPLPWPLDALASESVTAKVASVVTLLAAQDTAAIPDDLIGWLVEAVPPWVESLANG